MSLVLHIGMPKCASSALQTYLSTRAFSKDTQNRCVYLALQEDGRILRGEDLFASTAASPFAYSASHAGKKLSQYTDAQKAEVRAVLKDLVQEFEHVVLSCEAWGGAAKDFSDDCVFSDESLDVKLVAYIRPQIEWMNSAWWQWGAWTGVPATRWIQTNRSKAQWHRVLRQWRSKSWVKEVDIRILDDDVISDFASCLGVHSVSMLPHANQGLPGVMLRLFQRNRELRRNAHASAIEFIVSRQLQFGREYGATPWVMRPKLIAQLLDYYRQDNEALLDCLRDEQRERLSNDRLWWDPAAYADRSLQKAAENKIHVEDLERLAVDALQAISRLDAQLREFQATWMKIRSKVEVPPAILEMTTLQARERT